VFERRYRAVESRDARFDGWFFTAVTSTGIYCRPSCPALTPKRVNVRFFPTAAAAQGAGFRACRRCRPDASPGSPEWNQRADVVGRAMRSIADGTVDREGVGGLARRLGYSERQLQRLLVAEVGAGALALARAQRAQTARLLIETTDLSLAQVAFAAGFASVRQFNETVRAVFATTPSGLRRSARPPGTGSGTLSVRLPYRRPLAAGPLVEFLAARAVPGVEAVVGGVYHRSLSLPRGQGVVGLADDPAIGAVRATFSLQDLADLGPAVSRCRRLLDLDADPEAVDRDLRADPVLGPLVDRVPGRRVPGTVDGPELAVRAVLGQQVSVAGARTLLGRLVAGAGVALAQPAGPVTHLFPGPEALAGAVGRLGVPASRRAALVELAGALADGRVTLEPDADRERTLDGLRALPGIGRWTAAYVALRALSDPDAFLPTDLGVRRALTALGGDGRPAAVERTAEGWRPWRSYAVLHLWAVPAGGRRPADRPPAVDLDHAAGDHADPDHSAPTTPPVRRRRGRAA
jgi:AraC family transcriptional regulator of adaptative response / DNA-3-methyladenine glycosylase II